MRIGLIARADEGGLGRICHEFARHLHPDATLVVKMGTRARGTERLAKYDGDTVVVDYDDRLDPEPWWWLVEHCDVVYTAETTYNPRLADLCGQSGTRLVVHAMPELFDPEECTGADVWVPTWWRVAEVEAAHGRDVQVIPVPVALDRFPPRRRYEEPRLLHVAASAMLDRSGTELLAAALRYVKVPCTLVVTHAPRLQSTGCVTVEHRMAEQHYWSLYDDVSVLIAPRRYGGLSLVAQEAAAAGLGALVLDRHPDVDWPGSLPVACSKGVASRMKGGMIDVAQATPQALASGIDTVAASAAVRARLGGAARAWAAGRSWAQHGPRVAAALG